MFFRRSFLLAFLAFLAPAVSSQNYRSVKISHYDGTSTLVSIQNGMTTTMSDGIFSMQSAKGSFSIPLNHISSFSFSETPGTYDWTGIADTETDTPSVIVSDGIHISNLPQNTLIIVAGTDGRIVAEDIANEQYHFDFGNLVPGIYTLSFNGTSFKFLIRK